MPYHKCLVVQPIHPAGLRILDAAGIDAVAAPASDMQTVAALVGDCSGVITRNAGFSEGAIRAAPHLKVIAVHGIGTDPVAIDAASAHGIAVVNTPDTNIRSVAEHAIALLFALAKDVRSADSAARGGDFGFKYRARLVELEGRVFGIVGLGKIGQAAARLASALKLRVVGFSPTQPLSRFMECGADRVAALEELLARSDAVSLHVPLTPSTRGLIGEREISQMKPGAFLINTSRGSVVDEAALIASLKAGHLGGAGLDVFASESMDRSYELLRLPNVILTPHIAGSTEACLERTAVEVAEQVVDVLAGRMPGHLVNPEVWRRRR